MNFAFVFCLQIQVASFILDVSITLLAAQALVVKVIGASVYHSITFRELSSPFMRVPFSASASVSMLIQYLSFVSFYLNKESLCAMCFDYVRGAQ